MPKRGIVRLKDESGVVTLVTALGMVALLGMAALALDIAHLLSVKNELQRVADAGAMAGARGLWPSTMPIMLSPPSNPDCSMAQSRGLSVATHVTNKVDGGPLATADVDLQVGRWDYAASQFTAGCAANTNAVRVSARKPGVRMFFAGILGQGPMDLTATSTSVMDFAKGLGKGGLPIAINKRSVTPGEYVFINFSPDPYDNGGWFAEVADGANARTFRDYINYATCPPLHVGDIISLQNGQDTAVLHDLAVKLAERGGTWDTFLPVVDTSTFNHSEPIVAFVPFRLTQVMDHGNTKGVAGNVLGLAEAAMAEPGGINCGLLAPAKSLGVN